MRALLIAACPDGDLPSADEEISEAARTLTECFSELGVQVECDPVYSKDATLDTVTERLRCSNAHILHVAGHGTYDARNPGNSSLHFLPGRTGGDRLSADDLAELLQKSNIRFAYLGCCHAADTAPVSALGQSDFLGLADALVQAQVSAVLGFRIPPADDKATEFAVQFYRRFASAGDLDSALFETRTSFRRSDPRSLSAILVIQR